MTSSSVCQGLQSCLEPLLVEPRVLRLNLAPSKSIIFPSIPASSEPHNKENKTNTIRETNNKNNDFSDDMKSDKSEDTGGWSFLQCLSKETAAAHKKEYVHPLVKRSASMLSEKSLEMCTESLGSETGSQNSYHDMITADTMFINNNTATKLTRESFASKRTNRSTVSFPPPLTSISGSNGVQVRPRREGGRLVLQAVTVSSSQSYFHAERSGGRLRLCLVVKDADRSPYADDQVEEEGGGEEEDDDEDEEEDDEEEEEEEEEFEHGDEEVCCEGDEDTEGTTENVRGEIGIEKLTRPSRCKEGGRGAGNKLLFEPFWVAT